VYLSFYLSFYLFVHLFIYIRRAYREEELNILLYFEEMARTAPNYCKCMLYTCQ
jgi:hypothetical protein